MTDDEYADVRTLLRERTEAPLQRVDVDEVIRRGRRARRIRRADQALAVGAVLAVVVAAGVLVSRPHESTSPVGPSPSAVSPSPLGSSVVALPTSDWTPGSDALQALQTGTLTLDAKGCVVVDAGGGALTAVVWPRGTTGRRTAGGAVEVLAPDGSVAAATGDRVAMGGGAGGTPDPDPCVTAYGGAFVVMQAPPYTTQRDTPKEVLKAVANARANGSVRGPVEWVETTLAEVAARAGGPSGDPLLPMYVVQAHGDFVLASSLRPSNAGPPSGTVMIQFVAADGVAGPGGYGASNTTTDLSTYGTVHLMYP